MAIIYGEFVLCAAMLHTGELINYGNYREADTLITNDFDMVIRGGLYVIKDELALNPIKVYRLITGACIG